MCGIVGAIARSKDNFVSSKNRQAAISCIKHRGPDAQGEFKDGPVWFGHVRLSVLDLSPAGTQPMVSGGGDLVIAYNGEVYNYKDLSAELLLSNLPSTSDTAVILAAFEKLNTKSFSKFNGMFAFALYRKSDQKLFLVRDRLGIKPLYYQFDKRGLLFGSEIKAILTLGEKTPAWDIPAFSEWLYYGNPLGGRTLYQGIQQLPPGHYLELDLKKFTHEIKNYWSLKEHIALAGPVLSSSDQLIAETRRLLENAVRRQLVSDVPVGVFLSGGVDSLTVTAFASKHYNGKLATYSAGFDDLAGIDERPKARRIADHFGTDHHELDIRGANVPNLVEKMVLHHDMPFSDAANIPLYLMAEEIRGKTKVILQGDGGDELFGGYRRYTTIQKRKWLWILAKIFLNVSPFFPKKFSNLRVDRYLRSFSQSDLGLTMAQLLTIHDPIHPPTDMFTPRIKQILEPHNPFRHYQDWQKEFKDLDVTNQMSFLDLMIILPDTYLEKVDRATMAASLEVRVPFLDNELVDYVVRIPGHKKMPWGRKKWLLKKALEGIVPNEILYGPKTGFSVPFGYWLKTSLKPLFFDHLNKFCQQYPDVLDRRHVENLYAATGGNEGERLVKLWKLLNLMIWCNNSRWPVFLN